MATNIQTVTQNLRQNQRLIVYMCTFFCLSYMNGKWGVPIDQFCYREKDDYEIITN
jgi:hypothetical protein